MTIYRHRGIAARAVLFVFFCAAWANASGTVSPNAAPPTALVESYGKLPILFEGNRGQADPAARFIARGNGYAVYLTQDETLIALSRQSKLDRGATPSARPQTVIGMRFAGANQAAPLIGERKTESTSNYFLGPDPAKHITDIPHYTAVRRAGIYPGIDAIFYGNQRQLEYDLIVAPGADPRAIRLSFTGAHKVSIDRTGNLVLHGATGDVVQHKPVIHQDINGERKTVAGSYIKRGREVGFLIAAYDRSRPLIIDPVVSYATFLGGVKNDSGQAIAVDAAGNAYITGYTSSPKFPAANPIDRRIGHNEQDAFVVKLNATGTALIYSTYLGGSKGFDSGNGIAVDSAGNAYVAGTTTGKGFPTTTGAYQAAGSAWVAKLNPVGNALVYSTAIAGARINALALDAGGNAYVTGWTDSTFATTTGSFQSVNATKAQGFNLGSLTSAFVAKLNPTGTALVYGTYLAGYGTDEATGIALDQSGNAYVTGGTNSGNFPLQNPIQAVNRGGSPFEVTGQPGNAFITKLNSTGSGLVYSTFLGGGLMDVANAIAVDSAGSAHIVGTATSQDFPVHNSFQPLKLFDFYKYSAAFVAKLNAAGDALVYSSFIGGDRCPASVINICVFGDGDQGLAVALDSAGNAYYTGAALGERFPTLYSIQPNKRQGSNGLFIAKVAATGQAINIFMLGGSGIAGDPQSGDIGRGIAIDGVNAVYLTGDTSSIDFPVTPGAVQPTLLYNTRKDAGGQDAFIAKFTSPNYSVNIATSANPILAGQSVVLTSRVSTSTNAFPSTGSVTFMSNNANEGTVPVVNGSATTLITPTAGVKRISASYANQGDGGAAQLYQLVTPIGACQPATVDAMPAAGRPLVVITSPAPCSSVNLPETTTLLADALDPDGRIVSVDFYASGVLIGRSPGKVRDQNHSYLYYWELPSPAPGTYTLTAVATDNAGLSTTSSPVVFTVKAANVAPTIAITSPVSGSSVRLGTTATINTAAADSDGTIAQVKFFVNGALIGTRSAAPFSFPWSASATGTYYLTATAIDDNGAQTPSLPVTVDVVASDPPLVNMTAPANGAQYFAPATVPFSATASDPDGSILEVQFRYNGSLFSSVTTPPYVTTWTFNTPGTYVLTAHAIDNTNVRTVSAPVTITVIGNQLPTVSLTSPASGTLFTAPTDITLAATAADSDGTIAKVEFFAGTTLLATLTSAPYTFVWKNPLPGSYALTARATDNRGATTTSTAVPITVGGTAVRITAPADGTSLAAPAAITLQVSAVTASGNSLTKLEVFDGATLLRTFDVSGNSVNINYGLLDVEAGSHVYTVKATTSIGTTVTSAPVTVNVQAAATVQLSTLSNYYLAPAAIDLYANVTPAANTTIAKVEFFNGASLIGTVTASPYNFRWSNVVAGNYSLTAKVTDSRGLVVTSNSRSIAVSTSPPASLAITSPANQASLTADSIVVSGSYQAVANAGIVVNGVIATLDGVGNYFAEIPLTTGSNTVTALLTGPTGETVTSTVLVTAMPVNLPVTIAVSKNNGPAPLNTAFTVTNSGSVPLTYSVNGGTPVTLNVNTFHSLPVTYAQPGPVVTTFAIDDGMGNSTTKSMLIEVRDDVVTDLKLRAIWNDVGDKLRAGDVNGALAFITGGATDQYATLFNALKQESKLVNAVNALGTLRGSTVGSDIAEMIISRETVNGTIAFPVWYLRGPDGVWRLESM